MGLGGHLVFALFMAPCVDTETFKALGYGLNKRVLCVSGGGVGIKRNTNKMKYEMSKVVLEET